MSSPDHSNDDDDSDSEPTAIAIVVSPNSSDLLSNYLTSPAKIDYVDDDDLFEEEEEIGCGNDNYCVVVNLVNTFLT